MKALWLLVACGCLGMGACGAMGEVVRKTADAFDQSLWQNSQWNSGTGVVEFSSEVAPGCASTRSMQFTARFSGGGFEGVTVNPSTTMVIPGEAKSITIRVKRSDARYGLKMNFVDGWGKPTPGWDLPLKKTNEWETCTFAIPKTWVMPLTIEGLTTHNWGSQTVAASVTFLIDHLEVETDLEQVDAATGVLKTWKPEANPAEPAKAIKTSPAAPLVDVSISTGVESNVFAGEDPKVVVMVRNWKAGTLTGKATCDVSDDSGKQLTSKEVDVSVESSASIPLPLKVDRFGRYSMKASVSLSDGSKSQKQMTFAYLPAMKTLSDSQKTASPYGLNIHSGNKVVISPFKKAGIVWFREYAFQWDWLLRAKGADGKYNGWPHYQRMLKSYADEDVKILPVLQRSIKAPQVKGGKAVGQIGPDTQWTRELASIVLAFPQITHWELSNEYDLPNENSKAEELVGWANYRAYHKQFAEVVSLLSGGKAMAVENGRAGIWPRRERECVQSGDFDKIGAVNSHHYCGTDAPEENFQNYNMGFDASEQQMGSLYDVLRAVKQAAQTDGKKRESWFTEFGWDTLAGPIVSPYEQAVFLPRAWMLTLAAGTDKSFWFYNFDAKEANNFFDGCGLVGPTGEPKLSLCAMAGLTSVLPNPHYVGSLNAGENTWGYVFEDEGKLVAALYTVRGDSGPTVTIRAQRLVDYLGNGIDGNSVKLAMAPVYAVGLDKSDIWYKQTAYELKTPLMTGAAGGDTVRPILTIRNNRPDAINCNVSLALPEGWKALKPSASASVAPGETQDVEMPYTLATLEEPGVKDAKLIISEGQKLKEMPLRVYVQPALTMLVNPIAGAPGAASSTVRLTNLSAQPQNATLKIAVPSSWSVANPTIAVNDLKPREQRDIKFPVTWSPNWKPGESATVTLDAGGKSIVEPLIPSQCRMYPAGSLKMDGDLADWAQKNQWPGWILGTTAGKAQAKVYLAWAKEGLYGAVEVHDSKVVAKNPVTFWAGDVLELFIDTRGEKRARTYEAGDHQFWFVPQVEQNRVYVGQWKRGSEIAQTLQDIKGVRSAAKKTADGYVMEFLLPAEAMREYRPEAGKRVGLNLNLTIKGQKADREVYWPNAKGWGTPAHPEQWGTVELANDE